MMKILSIYLPGFHEDEVNNRAWGKGFTEWDNVKLGKPLYKKHYQPIVPLNNEYYDLSKKEHIKKQIDLAKKYLVDGFIFYHYWFGNGKMALQKPVQIYKNDISDKIDYCFCWANHSWIKNWHQGNSEYIEKQEYLDEKDWIEHINYFIDYFKDDKYIKINERPVLYIYNVSDIKCFDQMLSVWNKELNKNGIKNLYIVEYISSRNKKPSSELTDAVLEFEPLYTTYFDLSYFNLFKRFICKKIKIADYEDYNKIWKKIINRKRVYGDRNIQKGCFSNWDNSARKGHDSMIVKNASPENFYINLKKLVNKKRKKCNNDYVVINAWNEWSEGAILEPTEKDKYGYLEAIKKVKEEYENK